MKTKSLTYSAFALMILFGRPALAQDATSPVNTKKWYTTTGGEIIFSGATVQSGGASANDVVRFAPVFNFQNQAHRDFSDHVGFFTGVNIRNLGFIYDDPNATKTRYKLRAYTLGVPLAIKVGNMDGTFLFAGYEFELPFNYKEKKFVNEDKVEKFSDWFSSRTPSFYQSVFVGVQGPYGAQLKFKYYMTNFVNKSYAANDGTGNIIYPYQNLDANVFYLSLSFQFFKGTHFYYE